MVTIKTQEEIKKLKEGGKILATILDDLIKNVKAGVSTKDLEKLAVLKIKQAKAIPSFLNYRNNKEETPFPTALCSSINSEIVHAPSVPGRILKNGDLIGLDLGIIYQGL